MESEIINDSTKNKIQKFLDNIEQWYNEPQKGIVAYMDSRVPRIIKKVMKRRRDLVVEKFIKKYKLKHKK